MSWGVGWGASFMFARAHVHTQAGRQAMAVHVVEAMDTSMAKDTW